MQERSRERSFRGGLAQHGVTLRCEFASPFLVGLLHVVRHARNVLVVSSKRVKGNSSEATRGARVEIRVGRPEGG